MAQQIVFKKQKIFVFKWEGITFNEKFRVSSASGLEVLRKNKHVNRLILDLTDHSFLVPDDLIYISESSRNLIAKNHGVKYRLAVILPYDRLGQSSALQYGKFLQETAAMKVRYLNSQREAILWLVGLAPFPIQLFNSVAKKLLNF
jgi:hypothetical protein